MGVAGRDRRNKRRAEAASRRIMKGLKEGAEEKEIMELCHYAVNVDGYYVVPTCMAHDGENCRIELYVFDEQGERRELVLDGPHEDYLFRMTIQNTPLVVNLKTNVIKKDRRLSNTEGLPVKQLCADVRLFDGEIIEIARDYAQEQLTELCRSYAEEVTDTHYYWTLEEFGWAVEFELPDVFGITSSRGIHDVAYKLEVFAQAYRIDIGIRAENYLEMFRQNFEAGFLTRGAAARYRRAGDWFEEIKNGEERE